MCTLHSPVTRSQRFVQESPSWEHLGVPRQAPSWHWSPSVHGLPSLHDTPLALLAQSQPGMRTLQRPVKGSQSFVQAMPSGVHLKVPWQAPPRHLSGSVQRLPSLHDSPSCLLAQSQLGMGSLHFPVIRSQRFVQGSLSGGHLGAELHLPVAGSHVSMVHGLPSSGQHWPLHGGWPVCSQTHWADPSVAGSQVSPSTQPPVQSPPWQVPPTPVASQAASQCSPSSITTLTHRFSGEQASAVQLL